MGLPRTIQDFVRREIAAALANIGVVGRSIPGSSIVGPIEGVLTNPMTTEGDMIRGGTAGAATRLAPPTVGQVLTGRGTPNPIPTWESQDAALAFIIDGGGAAIETGIFGDAVEIPFGCSIVAVRLHTEGTSGNITVDVERATFGGAFASIVGAGTEPNIADASVSQWYQDTAFTSWVDTSLDAGDWLRFNVTAAATIEKASITLTLRRT